MVPKEIRSRSVKGSAANFRIVSSDPSRAMGGRTAFTRDPSGRRASTIGLDSSTRLPTRDTILSMVRRRCASSENRASTGNILPSRSMKMSSGPLTMISVIVLVAQEGLKGPVTQDVVGDVLGNACPVRERERRLLRVDHVLERHPHL